MNMTGSKSEVTRRQFVKRSSIAVAGALVAPHVITTHAAPDDPIRIGLIGCGGRGMGAVGNALGAGPNVKLVALADLFPEKLQKAREQFEKEGAEGNAGWAPGTVSKEAKPTSIKLADDHCFSGFDAYKKLLEIPEINYVIMATPPHFRPIHLRATIEAGKNAFIEKPVAVDPTGVRSIMESGELAKKKNLGIVAGTQRRHQQNYQEAIKRIQDGAVGKIIAARAYWNQGTHQQYEKRQPQWSDMEWQLRNWIYFTWLSGDIIVEQHLHNIDVINWIMGTHPIKAYGMGGRTVRTSPEFGYIYDQFCVEFQYPNEVRLTSMCRQIDNCSNQIGEAVAGSEGNSNCQTIITGSNPWRFSGRFRNPYEQEHADLIASIRAGQPLNEAQRAAESTLTAIMGRESAYSGQIIDWDSALESKLDLSPAKYEFGPLPVPPVALPGIYDFE
ncbi:MAG: Gfo/Idh/MocA family oxidoreductase [Candidatus Omnitrophica bacterium]|nr:Gfo/Idh/MocA family oxidoreductase [Candidatus Omnitrophota bacterium]